MPEVVSDLSQDIKKMLASYPQELKDGLPMPVIMGILVRVVLIGTDNS
jgi:hypothetical protein